MELRHRHMPSHNSSARYVLFSPVLQAGQGVVNNLPKVTQQVSSKAGAATQAIVPESMLLTIILGDNYEVRAPIELQGHKVKPTVQLDEGRDHFWHQRRLP